MSEPFTREKFGICGEMFEIPMERCRRSGWTPQDSTLSLTYRVDEDFYIENACEDCYGAIKESVENTVESLKKEKGPA